MGLLQSIATIVSGIIGTGLILLFIRARQRAGIREYLGLNRISWKTVLLVLGVVIGMVVLMDLVTTYACWSSQPAKQIVPDIVQYERLAAFILGGRGHLRTAV